MHEGYHCLGVASELESLILGLVAFDFSKGLKMLVPSNAYIESILSNIHAGFTPVLVELDSKTYNLTVSGSGKRLIKSVW